ncbi:hypothetical protein ACQ7CX_07595 [Chryseobacterium arthrosphaerae]|uniref:hypothetical protein n=1 Tax=Chryseobacterium arthrosphaerae TaxID=651561 RepID=UPI001BB00F1F|nr:hypothetical protein [Chryseobacterium arthrosphaerae]QUY56672.1 hypothetical protein I2F65_04855 [Chryseobacterium arthrosphaerae]
MKINLLLLLFPILFPAQKEPDYLQCYLKSLTTVCNENSQKIISEINSDRGVKIYGRFTDLQKGLSERAFEKYKDKISLHCPENIRYDALNKVYYSQESDDNRKFYFIYEGSPSKIRYKGTENNISLQPVDLNSGEKYLRLYNQEKKDDPNYEASFYYYNSQDQLTYHFHQHGNEFDEYTYFYRDSFYGPSLSEVYKNGILSEEYSYAKEDGTFEKRIREYNVNDSYQFNRKNQAVLKKSRYSNYQNLCHCKAGYSTTIIYRADTQCARNTIPE